MALDTQHLGEKEAIIVPTPNVRFQPQHVVLVDECRLVLAK